MRLAKASGLALVGGLLISPIPARAQVQPSAPGATAPSPATEDDEAMTELKEHHRNHHHGGVIHFIAMSLDTLGSDESKRAAIEKARGDLEVQLAPAQAAEKELLATIADGVAAGSVDKAKADAAIAKVASASEAAHAASLETLNKLHGILSPPERASLADKVQAHWEVWNQVNNETGGREKGGRLSGMAERLGLTGDQLTKIAAALKTAMAGPARGYDPKAAEAHVQAFATAFAGESFDAKSVTGSPGSHLASHGSARMALFYETITPLLTPEQRTKLAAHLREHAGHAAAD